MFTHQNILSLIFLQLFVSCQAPESSSSNIKFALTGSKGLVSVAEQSQVTICTNRMARASEIKNAVGMWFASINKKPDIQVVETGTAGRCNSIVNYENIQGASFTQISEQPLVTMNEQDEWFSGFPVLVHEFGHGFGLGDTYNQASRQAGDCVAGQPKDAVMCSPQFAQPRSDDIAGVRQIFGGNIDPNSQPDFSGFSNGSSGGDGSFVDNSRGRGNGSGGGRSVIDNRGSTGGGGSGTLPNQGGFPVNPPSIGGPFDSILTLFAKFLGGSVGDRSLALAGDDFSGSNIEGYCANGFAITMSSESGNKQLAVFQRLKSQNLTVCIGDNQQCAGPHSTRLVTRVVMDNQSSGFVNVTNPISEANLQLIATKKNQSDKSGATIFTIDGVLTESNSGNSLKAFRCVSTLKEF